LSPANTPLATTLIAATPQQRNTMAASSAHVSIRSVAPEASTSCTMPLRHAAASRARSRLRPAHFRNQAHRHKRRARGRASNARRRLHRRTELSGTIERLPLTKAVAMNAMFACDRK
jgi:hypothetical protein